RQATGLSATWFGQAPAPSSRRLLKGEAQDVPAQTGPPDFPKARVPERVDKSHEAIAGGLPIDGIGFDDFRVVPPGFLDCRHGRLFGTPAPAPFALHEDAGQRPHGSGIAFEILVPAELAIGCARRDRTPCHRLTFEVAEEADRDAVGDPRVQGFLAVLAVALPSFGRHGAPDHAPAALWTAAGLEQTFEIAPVGL